MIVINITNSAHVFSLIDMLTDRILVKVVDAIDF